MTRSSERFKTTSALSVGLAAVYYGSAKIASREMYIMWDDGLWRKRTEAASLKIGIPLSTTVLLATYIRMYVLHKTKTTMRFWKEKQK